MKEGNLNEEGNYRKTEGNKIHAETRDCLEHNNIEPGTFIKVSRHGNKKKMNLPSILIMLKPKLSTYKVNS